MDGVFEDRGFFFENGRGFFENSNFYMKPRFFTFENLSFTPILVWCQNWCQKMYSKTFHIRLTGPENLREARSTILDNMKDVIYKRLDQDWLVSKVDFLDGILKFDRYMTLVEVKRLLRNMGVHPGLNVDISILDGK